MGWIHRWLSAVLLVPDGSSKLCSQGSTLSSPPGGQFLHSLEGSPLGSWPDVDLTFLIISSDILKPGCGDIKQQSWWCWARCTPQGDGWYSSSAVRSSFEVSSILLCFFSNICLSRLRRSLKKLVLSSLFFLLLILSSPLQPGELSPEPIPVPLEANLLFRYNPQPISPCASQRWSNWPCSQLLLAMLPPAVDSAPGCHSAWCLTWSLYVYLALCRLYFWKGVIHNFVRCFRHHCTVGSCGVVVADIAVCLLQFLPSTTTFSKVFHIKVNHSIFDVLISPLSTQRDFRLYFHIASKSLGQVKGRGAGVGGCYPPGFPGCHLHFHRSHWLPMVLISLYRSGVGSCFGLLVCNTSSGANVGSCRVVSWRQRIIALFF